MRVRRLPLLVGRSGEERAGNHHQRQHDVPEGRAPLRPISAYLPIAHPSFQLCEPLFHVASLRGEWIVLHAYWQQETTTVAVEPGDMLTFKWHQRLFGDH